MKERKNIAAQTYGTEGSTPQPIHTSRRSPPNHQAQAEEDGESIRQIKRPRAIVLVPTRELAAQVLGVAKRLSRTCKFSSCGVVGGEDYGKQRQRLAGTVDMVVATPGEVATRS